MKKQIFLFLVLVLSSIIPTSVFAEEECVEGVGCPLGQVYRQYKCPEVPWDMCDPYELYANVDEKFCSLIIYPEGVTGTPFQREVPGEYCYYMHPWEDAWVCGYFSTSYVAVWTINYPPGILSVYVNSLERNPVFIPMLDKNPIVRRRR